MILPLAATNGFSASSPPAVEPVCAAARCGVGGDDDAASRHALFRLRLGVSGGVFLHPGNAGLTGCRSVLPIARSHDRPVLIRRIGLMPKNHHGWKTAVRFSQIE